ncbi:hypothetical protein AKJ09_02235 [Labilithrix luteola]|uniref:Uncharacterized protein n=1 Tax=Labilithrix luteola TaxID=1391654 RepID=A0A0K1PQA1_9BACT|nr:hypothetical protein AKJ09_02235 [Labilithrix luteola]
MTEPEPDTTPPAERFDLSLKLEGGYELGALDGRGTGGPRWGVGLGAQNDEMGWWITLRGRLAEPSVGVHAWDARLGVDADVLRAGITHIGVGSELGVMGQPGPTGATRPTFTCGLGARAGLDLVRFGDRDRSALTLDLRGDVQVLATSGSYATIALLAAVRF